MKRSLSFFCLFAIVGFVLGESTQSFKDAVAPLARKCMPGAEASEGDYQTVLNRNPLENRNAKCLLACVYGELGAFASEGHLLNGDNVMPIMDKLYGFKEFKTVMRAQVVHDCVVQVNGADEDKCELVMHFLHCVLEHY